MIDVRTQNKTRILNVVLQGYNELDSFQNRVLNTSLHEDQLPETCVFFILHHYFISFLKYIYICYYVHFQVNTFGNGMKSLILPAMG